MAQTQDSELLPTFGQNFAFFVKNITTAQEYYVHLFFLVRVIGAHLSNGREKI